MHTEHQLPPAIMLNGKIRSVAMMCESDALGGAETVILRLAEELTRRGYRIVGVGPDEQSQPDRGSNGWLRMRFDQAGFEWLTYRQRRGVDPACVSQLTGLLRKSNVDVVHSHEITMAIYGTAACKIAGLPHVISMHGNQHVGETWKSRLAMRWAIANSRETVAVSTDTLAHLERVLRLRPGSVRVIRNGVPERPGDRRRGRSECGAHPQELLVIAVGSLIPRKNHEALVRALGSISLTDPHLPWRLVIAGAGPERGRLDRIIGELGLEERIRLLGPREDVPDLLAGADIFAMPSTWEGLPLALLEAMYAGKAIVASAVAGIPEAIENGVEGLLVPANNQDELVRALRTLLADWNMRASLGCAAQGRAQREFSMRAMTDRYEECYWARAAVAEVAGGRLQR